MSHTTETNASKGEPNARALTPLDYGLYAASVLTWGLSWIAMHYQVGTVVPEVSVVWRFAIAAPLMFVLAALRGESLRYRLADHRFFIALAPGFSRQISCCFIMPRSKWRRGFCRLSFR